MSWRSRAIGHWLRGGNTRDIASRIPTIEVLGQRIGVIERQYAGQKVGEIVSSVKLPTLAVQVA